MYIINLKVVSNNNFHYIRVGHDIFSISIFLVYFNKMNATFTLLNIIFDNSPFRHAT